MGEEVFLAFDPDVSTTQTPAFRNSWLIDLASFPDVAGFTSYLTVCEVIAAAEVVGDVVIVMVVTRMEELTSAIFAAGSTVLGFASLIGLGFYGRGKLMPMHLYTPQRFLSG